MKNITERFTAQSKDVCSRPDLSTDAMYFDASAGCHQRLVREEGRRVLVVRIAHGIYDRIPLIEFDHSGVQA